jgi:hypothetical protein
VENWLCYWVAKPIAWATFGLWIAVLYTWFAGCWCARKAREKWTVWRAKREINGSNVVATVPSIPLPSKRGSKRQAA